MSLPRVFYLGPVPVYLFGVTIALGILAGTILAVREARRRGYNPERVVDLVLYLMIAGIAGARLMYVALEWDMYRANPLEILMLNHGGLSWHGALIGGILVAIWYLPKMGIPFWRLADFLAPSIALGYAIARVGCDIYGKATTVPWAVEVAGSLRHPAQLYSSLSSYLIFFILWQFRDRTRYDGQLFLMYVVLYSLSRGIIEYFREGQMVFGGLMSVAQLVSLGAVVAAFALMLYLGRRNRASAGV